jgi:hypothetical protein
VEINSDEVDRQPSAAVVVGRDLAIGIGVLKT